MYDAIVILGGGTGDIGLARVSRGCDVIRSGLTRNVVLVGSLDEVKFMLERIRECTTGGVDVYYDGNSRDTIDNAYYAKQILESLGARRIGLITSEFHMERALAIFEWMLGDDYMIEPIPVRDNPSDDVLEREFTLRKLIPFLKAFRKGDSERIKRFKDRMLKLIQKWGFIVYDVR